MPRFGWMRLTCLFLVLSVLAALARLDGDAEARSLAAPVPDAVVFSSEEPEPPVVRQWTEDQISSLQNVSEDALSAVGDPRPAEPRPRTVPSPKDTGRPPAGRDTAGGGPPGVLAAEPPVFYRPAGPGEDAPSGPVCGDLSGAPEGGRIVFPLERRFFYSYDDTWGAPRTQGGHEGTDLMTPSGVPEYAITDGTVVPVAGSNADGWNSLGGHAVMVRADYSIGPVKAGDLFYYAHLVRESPLEIGDRVNAGQVVGYAGDTGQGPPGTSGLFPPHLHLGWYDATGDRQDADSGAMNPYPLLEWIKSNGGAVSGGSDARFCEAPRTGPPTPSAHDHPWPTPANPGLSPDLDTGSRNPEPIRNAAEAADDRNESPPAKKTNEPPRPDPRNEPKKDREGNPPKRPNGPERTRDESPQGRSNGSEEAQDDPPPERPNAEQAQSQRPDRNDEDPGRPPQPAPGGDQQPPPASGPPEKDPPPVVPPEPATPTPSPPAEDQYDDATGGTSGPAGDPPEQADRDPQADQKPASQSAAKDTPANGPPRRTPSEAR